MASNLSMSSALTSNFVFIGYNTANYQESLSSVLYDVDLINADLMIAFQTKVGERVMRPDWGCRIWEYLMNPMDEYTVNAIIAEAQRIVGLDSRLEQQGINVYQDAHVITIEIQLLYNPLSVIGTFLAKFESQDTAYFSGTTTN